MMRVIQSSPRMHYQDLGRFGHAHVGISQGGSLDLHAHCWANFLLENDPSATTIEISVGNALFMAEEDSVIALTGAEMSARIDGRVIENWCTHFIKKGEVLKLGYAKCGTHGYLAVKGGFIAPEMLGSSATVVRNYLGEYLTEDDVLRSKKSDLGDSFIARKTPEKYVPNYDDVRKIRLILAPDLDAEVGEKLLETNFSISPHSDRMGVHLIAENPLPKLPGITSEGIPLGSIQLTPSGHPIVLLNDRQTQGGYAKIGNVARVDLPLLTQAKAMTKIGFEAVSHEQAVDEWREFSRFFGL